VLLDTCIRIDYLRGRTEAVRAVIAAMITRVDWEERPGHDDA